MTLLCYTIINAFPINTLCIINITLPFLGMPSLIVLNTHLLMVVLLLTAVNTYFHLYTVVCCPTLKTLTIFRILSVLRVVH